jgi:hypothetical protein
MTKARGLHLAFAAGGVLCVVLSAALGARPAYASTSASVVDYSLHLDSGSAPKLAGRRVGTFLQAVRAFGKPALVVPGAQTTPTCKVFWPRSGLEIDFSTTQPGACAARNLGAWSQVTARGARWHSYAGLRVGDTERKLHTLYPTARRLDFLGLGRLWELETGGPLCDGGPPFALAAQVRAGRISALAIVHVPACG